MTYKLLPTMRGIITEQTEVFADVKGSTELSFLIEKEGQHVAVFVDEKGMRYCVQIINGVAAIPTELLSPQHVQLFVRNIAKEAMYICEPFKISRFTELLKDTYVLSGHFSESAAENKLAQLETQLANFALECKKLKTQNEQLAANNKIIAETLQKLAKQIYLMEKNYNVLETIGGSSNDNKS